VIHCGFQAKSTLKLFSINHVTGGARCAGEGPLEYLMDVFKMSCLQSDLGVTIIGGLFL